jgi:class 3 adenylate cyclase
MVEILERHRGVVTQFQGDAILATFNVPVRDPDHAANAVRAAIEMQRMVREHTFAGHRIEHRIGINTGPVVAGAVGAEGRLSYTVHGDTVNLASRLEALNKTYGSSVLMSNTTAAVLHDFPLDAVGEVMVRGQSRPVTLFALRLEAETAPDSRRFGSVSAKPTRTMRPTPDSGSVSG